MANSLIPETNVCPSKELATCGVKMLFTNRNLLFFFRNIIESDKDTGRERQGWGGELKEIKKKKEGMGKEKKRKKEGGRREGGGRERERKKELRTLSAMR